MERNSWDDTLVGVNIDNRDVFDGYLVSDAEIARRYQLLRASVTAEQLAGWLAGLRRNRPYG